MKAELEKLHDTPMAILETVGIRLYHPEIVTLLKQNGISQVGINASSSHTLNPDVDTA